MVEPRFRRFYKARTEYNQHGEQSMDEVYAATGVSKSLISTAENSSKDRDIGCEKVAKLAKHYGVSVDYLMGLTDCVHYDTDLRAVCDYTGLSEDTATALHHAQRIDVFGKAMQEMTENGADVPPVMPIEADIINFIAENENQFGLIRNIRSYILAADTQNQCVIDSHGNIKDCTGSAFDGWYEMFTEHREQAGEHDVRVMFTSLVYNRLLLDEIQDGLKKAKADYQSRHTAEQEGQHGEH